MTRAGPILLLMLFAAALAALLLTSPRDAALAQGVPQIDTPLADPALEARARKLMADVRCVVCQAQSIAESDAGIAADMRQLIRSEIAAGRSDAEIRRYLADRYGDFVLFKPPFKATTVVLWAGPFLLLGLGAMIILIFFRKRTTAPAQGGLSADEMRRVEEALREPAEAVKRPDPGSGS